MNPRDPKPEHVVEQYFAAMQAGDACVTDLFHDDAELVGLGTVVRGRPAIDAFYAASIAAARPTPRLLGPLLVAENRVAAEIAIALADASTMHVLDLFEIRDSRIHRLTYFVADEGQPTEPDRATPPSIIGDSTDLAP